jgi:hypothetical protein
VCYGLLKIDRRVDLETQIDLQQIDNGNTSDTENKNENESEKSEIDKNKK